MQNYGFPQSRLSRFFICMILQITDAHANIETNLTFVNLIFALLSPPLHEVFMCVKGLPKHKAHILRFLLYCINLHQLQGNMTSWGFVLLTRQSIQLSNST